MKRYALPEPRRIEDALLGAQSEAYLSNCDALATGADEPTASVRCAMSRTETPHHNHAPRLRGVSAGVACRRGAVSRGAGAGPVSQSLLVSPGSNQPKDESQRPLLSSSFIPSANQRRQCTHESQNIAPCSAYRGRIASWILLVSSAFECCGCPALKCPCVPRSRCLPSPHPGHFRDPVHASRTTDPNPSATSRLLIGRVHTCKGSRRARCSSSMSR
eukprot:3245131-Rhodomonas_salina.2